MKQTLALSGLLLATGLGSAMATEYETLEGVLKRGAVWSALFSVSEESGDLIGLAFRNQSPVSQVVLAQCLPDMPCRIEGAVTESLDEPPGDDFTDTPSGWFEIKQAATASLASFVDYTDEVETRFGRLSTTDWQDETPPHVVFQGRPALPQLDGNGSLSLVGWAYELGDSDVVLLQNTGGTACPALFHFITVSARGIMASPEFGTCSDLVHPVQDESGVTVFMVDSDLKRVVYRYRDGRVTENDKPVQ